MKICPIWSMLCVLTTIVGAAGLLGGCGSTSESLAPVPAEVAIPTAGPLPADLGPVAVSGTERPAEVTPIDWSRAPDCSTALGWLDAEAGAGRLGPDAAVPVTILLPDATTDTDWLQPASLEVAADLPISLIDGNAGGAGLGAPCLIQVGHPRDQRSAHRVIAEDQVRSEYQSSVRKEPNPDYELAKARVKQLERDARDSKLKLIRVGNPLIDLVGQMVGGVIDGFDRGQSEAELNQALTELAATPRSLDHPVYRPYHFDRVVVQAGKEAVVPVTLHDRTTGAVRSTQLRQRERREFFILDGLDPRDRDYRQWRQASIDQPGLRRWLEAPPKLASTALVAALLEAPAGSPADDLFVATPPDPGRPAPQVLPPRTIEVAGEARTGPGAAERQRSARAGRPRSPDGDQTPLAADETLLVGLAPSAGASAPLGRRPLMPAGPTVVGARTPPPSATEPTSPSLVRIVVGARVGGGFYVGPDRILTTAQLVGNAHVVEVIGADGVNVLGVIARTDPVHDLALVHTPRPGQPIDLEGDLPPAAQAVLPVSAAEVLAFVKGPPTP